VWVVWCSRTGLFLAAFGVSLAIYVISSHSSRIAKLEANVARLEAMSYASPVEKLKTEN
jgi:hypothetical protein